MSRTNARQRLRGCIGVMIVLAVALIGLTISAAEAAGGLAGPARVEASITESVKAGELTAAADAAWIDSAILPSTSAQSVTTTTLGSNFNPSALGSTVTFTATVAGAGPQGTVRFAEGGVAISGCGAVALMGSGVTCSASCTTNALAIGAHSITASYGGDAANLPSASAVPVQTVVETLPGTGTIVANPYGTMTVTGATMSGNTISDLTSNVIIELGPISGADDSNAEIDFQGFNLGPGIMLTVRSGAAAQMLVLYDATAAASSISGTLLAQGGSGAAPPAIYLWNPSGIAIGPTGIVSAPSGLTLDALGSTWTTGDSIVNAGSIDGGVYLTLFGANIKGGGSFNGNDTAIVTYGSANNPVNGAHYLANGLQLFPSTGSDVALTINDYGNAPQYINLKVNGNARLSMPSAWPSGWTLPPNNQPVPPGGVRAPGVPDPSYGASSSIFQATGSMTLSGGTSNDFVFAGGVVLNSGGTLDLNGVIVNQGWTTAGQAFQGTYFESPNVVSSAGNIQVFSNNLNWVNFSTLPHAPVRTWTLVRAADGSAQYAAADSVAPHLNTYSLLIDAAANGQCWTCLVNYPAVNMY